MYRAAPPTRRKAGLAVAAESLDSQGSPWRMLPAHDRLSRACSDRTINHGPGRAYTPPPSGSPLPGVSPKPMTGVRNGHADRAKPSEGLASWHVPGRTDGFGDRLLMFDNTDTPSLELLRFRHDLASTPGFEDELRERVRQLSAFRHPAFSSVRAVQRLDDGESLALVSVHAPGQRLSDLFEQRPLKPLNPGTVIWLLRELTSALTSLQAEGSDVSHGAVTPDRIVLTPEGRLCIVEHVLGSALQHLEIPSARLWGEFGLVALPQNSAAPRLDALYGRDSAGECCPFDAIGAASNAIRPAAPSSCAYG